jgi:hypothetical protein
MRQNFCIRKYCVLFFILFASATGHGQKVVLSGKITNKDTGEPIPYATIVFQNTMIGTTSNTDGYYSLEANDTLKVLQVSAVGFIKQFIPTDTIRSSVLNIELKEEVIPIAEIEVSPGVNPAHRIMREISARKKENDPAFFPDWQSSLYSKIEIDLKNIKKPEKKDSKFWDQIGFIFEYIDTLEMDGKTFLPVFITETFSDYYHVKGGNDHERITANKISGMQTGMISEFTGKLYTDVNPYDNFINMSDIGLISPLNDQGLSYYRYFLRDSSLVEGRKIYELSFFPRQEQTPAFKGKLWIDSTTYALTRIEMRLSPTANINFLRDLVIEKDYTLTDQKYVPGKESFWIDFNLQKKDKGKLIGLIGRKTVVYRDFKFEPVSPKIVNQKKEVSVSPDAFTYNEQYWDSLRPLQLQEREALIYSMVDSLKNVPVIKTVFDYIQMFLFGYKDVGAFEIGPYFYMYSFNDIEGNRFRFGGRTTATFHDKLRLNGYLAYGLRDEAFKYSGGFEYFFRKDKRFSVEAQYKHDYELFGRSDNAFAEDNILMAILAKRPLSKLNMVNRFSLQADKEWTTGLSNTLKLSTTKIKSGPFVPFIDREGSPVGHIQNTEISLNTRIAPRERTVLGKFEKVSLGSPLPIVNFRISAGVKGPLSGDYSYLRLQTDIYDKLPLNPVGYTTYLVQAGRIWGDVPFPLMKIHEGNETYTSDRFAFNLMNYQEYVSDRYAALFLEHHFQGFFFNRVPLFRKLQLREVVGGRWLIGEMDESRHKDLAFPEEMQSLNGRSYGEISAGIENILKIIRIDAVWRRTGSSAEYDRFGILFTLQFNL